MSLPSRVITASRVTTISRAITRHRHCLVIISPAGRPAMRGARLDAGTTGIVRIQVSEATTEAITEVGGVTMGVIVVAGIAAGIEAAITVGAAGVMAGIGNRPECGAVFNIPTGLPEDVFLPRLFRSALRLPPGGSKPRPASASAAFDPCRSAAHARLR